MDAESPEKDKVTIATTTRQYNREELFRLAKLMPNTEQEKKDIDEYESMPCSKLNLDSIPISPAAASVEKDDQHLKFILRRQHSDLNFTSLNHDRRYNSWRDLDQTQLSSMASDVNSMKPELGGKGRDFVQNNRMHSNIPRSERITSASINYSRRAPLLRSTSNFTHCHRANSFYETPRHRPAQQVEEQIDNRYSSLNFRQTEDVDFSPIQRFGLVEKVSGEGAGELKSIEDDDFDLTKLLSITVLSDIKTIRQDSLLNSGRKTNNMERTSGRTQKDNSSRPFTRSQTSTDFTYNGRKLNSEYNRLKHNQRHLQQQASLTRYDVTPDLYSFNQPRSTFPNRFLVNNQAVETTKQDSKGKVDERLAIIESFKAQVRARAMDPTLTPPKPALVDASKTSSPVQKEFKNMDTDESKGSKSKESNVKETPKTANISPDTNSSKVEKGQDVTTKGSLPKKSQIPRLLSLHKTKLPSNTPTKTDLKSEDCKD